jgi:hypothetical protein
MTPIILSSKNLSIFILDLKFRRKLKVQKFFEIIDSKIENNCIINLNISVKEV